MKLDLEAVMNGLCSINDLRASARVTPVDEAIEYSKKALEVFNETGLPKEFKAQANTNGYEITMYDVIGSETCNSATFAAALQDANGAPITLRMSSPGGSVWDGWTMYNNLANYSGDTTVIVDGVAASIASIISLGAKKVLTQPTSMWMVHNASVLTYGDKDEVASTLQSLIKIDQSLADVYARKTGMDAADWTEMMNKETWLTAKEAVQLNLAHAFAESEPQKSKTKAQAIAQTYEAKISDKTKSIVVSTMSDLNAVLSNIKAEDSDDDVLKTVDDIRESLVSVCNTLLQEETEMKLQKALRIRRAIVASKL